MKINSYSNLHHTLVPISFTPNLDQLFLVWALFAPRKYHGENGEDWQWQGRIKVFRAWGTLIFGAYFGTLSQILGLI